MRTENTKNLKNYIHNIGVAKRYYICPDCGSKHMVMLLIKYDKRYAEIIEVTLECEVCHAIVINPEWVGIAEPYIYEAKPSEPWISFDDMEMIVTLKQFQLN